MTLSLLLTLLLAAPAGTISGRISPPENFRYSKPVEVAVFPVPYADMYAAEAQKHLDQYWEDYKGVFIQDKGAFVFFRERAKVQAMQYTMSRMRSENPHNAAAWIASTSNGSFEFRGVPAGACKVMAHMISGAEEFVWYQSVMLKDGATINIILQPGTP